MKQVPDGSLIVLWIILPDNMNAVQFYSQMYEEILIISSEASPYISSDIRWNFTW